MSTDLPQCAASPGPRCGSAVSRLLGPAGTRALAVLGAPAVVLAAYAMAWGLPAPIRKAGVSKLDESLIALAVSLLTLVLLQARPLVPRGPRLVNPLLLPALLSLVGAGVGLVGLASARSVSAWHLLPAGIGFVVGMTLYHLGRGPGDPGSGRVRLTRLVLVLLLPGLVYMVSSPGFAEWLRASHRGLGWPGGAIDKNSHYFLSAGLLPLLIACRPAGRTRPIASAVLSVGLLLAAGPVVETLQQKTGRGVETADVAAHLLGTVYGCACWVGWRLFVPLRHAAQPPA